MDLLNHFEMLDARADKPSIVRARPELVEGMPPAILKFMNPIEAKVLAAVLKRISGDYMEIGVNEGHTARYIADLNPEKMVYGVDLVDTCTMAEGQQVEQPTLQSVARACENTKNFRLILQNSWDVKIPESVKMVLIDADHSYQGIKNDTFNVLSQMDEGYIFWHDYGNNYDYMGVTDFIDREMVPRLKVYVLEWVMLAFAKL